MADYGEPVYEPLDRDTSSIGAVGAPGSTGTPDDGDED